MTARSPSCAAAIVLAIAAGLACSDTATQVVDSLRPTSPEGLTATTVSPSRIDLEWNTASDNVAVSEYRVLRDGAPVAITSSTSYSDTGLSASTTYDYAVTALDAAGNESDPSATASATTLATADSEPPTVPTGLAATAVSPGRIDLDWNAASDNVAVAEYRVLRDGASVATTSSASYSDTGLSASTTYDYAVTALDAAGNESDPSATASATTPDEVLEAFGIVGDSNSDEYRADDSRGGAYGSTTLNWAEILAQTRDIDFGPWGTRAEPRRSGFAYNWARSGAVGSSLISSGQHQGLAQQVDAGLVSTAVVYIGINDFSVASGEYGRIYDGSLSGAELQEKLDDFVGDVTMAVDAILAAGSVRVVIVSVPDEGLAPETVASYPNPAQRQIVSAAIAEVNGGLSDLADDRGVAFGDSNAMAQVLLGQVDGNGFLDVGGESINLLQRGNEPHFFRLDDGFGHPGTIASGLLLNFLILEPLNETYDLGITLLSDTELLEAAGIS